MLHKYLTFIFLLTLSACFLTCCKDAQRTFESREVLGSSITDAFEMHDGSRIKELLPPNAPKEITNHLMQFMIQPIMDLNASEISLTYTTLENIPIELPGSLKGRDLQFTNKVDGVIHVSGILPNPDLDDGEFDLYFPYTQDNGTYYITGVDYAP
ncbi:hypothetical protein [Rubritalea sp.]|uniref:hypothetical protein n=1 Tax=Rubritalea sp. TaxID=2109375 RepID=UPI003EF1A80C